MKIRKHTRQKYTMKIRRKRTDNLILRSSVRDDRSTSSVRYNEGTFRRFQSDSESALDVALNVEPHLEFAEVFQRLLSRHSPLVFVVRAVSRKRDKSDVIKLLAAELGEVRKSYDRS